jgi:putative thiamine transport system substrate-binding protein
MFEINNPETTKTPMTISRRQILASLTALSSTPFVTSSWAQANAATHSASNVKWQEIEKAAKGQTVYFNAWAGSEQINAYLQWVAAEVKAAHGVTLEHVKITDTGDVVKRVRGEKAAGKLAGGSVDMIWINGENFLNMKKEGLLFGPFAEQLPSFQYVDTKGKPTTQRDFAEPTAGLEAPWGMAQLTFMADSKRLPAPPQNMQALLALAKANPGRVTYPRLPNFHGTTFVKQALLELSADQTPFGQPLVADRFAATTAPLWAFLDQLHPHLWRAGKQYPENSAAVRQMMADGELIMALTFNPNEAANEIAAKRLPETVTSWQFAKGTVGNTHFVAIPFNAKAKEGAQVLANFLLSPKAQARKADIAQWGDPTVLNVANLPAAQKTLFTSAALPGQVVQTAPTWPEPHGSWVEPLEKEWLKRYGA